MPRGNNRGGNRGGNRGSRNNNPEGRNQYSSDWGVVDMARERPFAAAAAAAAAVGAGVFLWSRRNQISDQISSLSDQIGEWTENMTSGMGGSEEFDDTAGLTTAGGSSTGRAGKTSRSTGSRSTMTSGTSPTGGGNSSLGASSGGGGTPTV